MPDVKACHGESVPKTTRSIPCRRINRSNLPGSSDRAPRQIAFHFPPVQPAAHVRANQRQGRMAANHFRKIRRSRMIRRLEADVVSRVNQNRHPLLFTERPYLFHPLLQWIELLIFRMHLQAEQPKILHMMQFTNHIFIVRMNATHRQRRPMVPRRNLFVQRMGLIRPCYDG